MDDMVCPVISKETQYRIYAGTKMGDFTGWEKVETDPSEEAELWTLDLGNGYYLDRINKRARKFFMKHIFKYICLRRDRTVEDPDGDYKDTDLNVLFDVSISLSEDSIRFDGKNSSFTVLSRVPVDWEDFKIGAPESSKEEDGYSSFYR